MLLSWYLLGATGRTVKIVGVPVDIRTNRLPLQPAVSFLFFLFVDGIYTFVIPILAVLQITYSGKVLSSIASRPAQTGCGAHTTGFTKGGSESFSEYSDRRLISLFARLWFI